MPGVPERAIQNVKVLPEFDRVEIALSDADEIAGWSDLLKVQRVLAVRVDFEICVSDNGPGILDDICEFRAARADRGAKDHHGKVTVAKSDKRGTTFQFVFLSPNEAMPIKGGQAEAPAPQKIIRCARGSGVD